MLSYVTNSLKTELFNNYKKALKKGIPFLKEQKEHEILLA